MLTITKLAGVGNQQINDYLLLNERVLLYSNYRFIGLITEHLDAESSWLMAWRDGELVGVLPYIYKFGPLGPVFNSLAYYGSNGGIIQHKPDYEAKAGLVNAFYEEASVHNACSATLITNPLEQDADFYNKAVDYNFRDERIGQFTCFDRISSESDLLKLFDEPRPRNIRRALKEGIKVEKSRDVKTIDFLFSTHQQNINAVEGLPKDKSFFEQISTHMQQHEWDVFIASLHGKPIAGLLLFYFNRTVEYFTPVIVEAYRSSQPLALIIYYAMLDSVDRGFKYWNWGGTWLSQGGVYDFKKRWGTIDYPYYYYTKIFNSSVLDQCIPYFLEHYKGCYVIPFDQLKSSKLKP